MDMYFDRLDTCPESNSTDEVEGCEWPVPKPLPPEQSPVKPFTQDLLPASLAKYAIDVAERLGTAVEFVMVALLTSLGALLGRSVMVQPKRLDTDWTLPANLWGLVIGHPGTKKSSALGLGMKFFERIQVLWREDSQKRRIMTSNTSIEKLADMLVDNPNGMMLFGDELAGFIEQMNQKGYETARGFYLSGWNGKGSYPVDRIGRGEQMVENICISVLGGIQPKRLERLIRNNALTEDGLMQRFQMMVCPDPVPPRGIVDRPPNVEAAEAISAVFQKAASFVEQGETTLFTFADQAQGRFYRWLEHNERRTFEFDGSDELREHLIKYNSLVPKLAMLFQIAVDDQTVISLEQLEHAVSFVELLESHAVRVYEGALNNPVRAAKRILNKIQASKVSNPFFARDIYKNDWSGLKDTTLVYQALDLLSAYGYLKQTEFVPAHRGYKHVINPRLLNQQN